jgi:polyhydroxybutyrate depolymerase
MSRTILYKKYLQFAGVVLRKGSITMLFMIVCLFISCSGLTPIQDTLKPGTHEIKLDIRLMGARRNYLLHIPQNYRKGDSPALVIALHGAFSTAREFEERTGFSRLADREGFIVAYPNGGFGLFGFFQHWNAGHCCGKAAEDNVDDVGFLMAVINDVEDRLQIDTGRIYMTGFSNGGMLTYRFAAEKTDILAAAAPLDASAGGRAEKDDPLWVIPQPVENLPMIVFHGADDLNVPFAGGISPEKGGEREYLSVEESLAIWVRANSCNPDTKSETLYGGRVHKTTWNENQYNEISLYIIDDWGHKWPGKYITDQLNSDDSLKGFDAAEIIWEFFKKHRK